MILLFHFWGLQKYNLRNKKLSIFCIVFYHSHSLIEKIVGPLWTTIQLFDFFCVFKKMQIGFSPLATCICIWQMIILYASVEHVQCITPAPKYHTIYYTVFILSCKFDLTCLIENNNYIALWFLFSWRNFTYYSS